MVTRGTAQRLTEAMTLIARYVGEPVGAATFVGTPASAVALLSLHATVPRRGVGSALLAAVEDRARADGVERVWLITTNDNVDALRFYQRRGYRIVAVDAGAVDEARRLKPGIPEVGAYGIPIHDEIQLQKMLR
jgi:ribosomal protein S18 acetylase RimI-like enzyme